MLLSAIKTFFGYPVAKVKKLNTLPLPSKPVNPPPTDQQMYEVYESLAKSELFKGRKLENLYASRVKGIINNSEGSLKVKTNTPGTSKSKEITEIKGKEVVAPDSSKPLVEWFLCDKKKLNEPSVAEQKIKDILSRYKVKSYTEVSFTGFITPQGGHYRFDFYIPSINTLIEYDGSTWHSSESRIQADEQKTLFCKQNDISLIRYNKKHYYQLDTHIDNLMKKYQIAKK